MVRQDLGRGSGVNIEVIPPDCNGGREVVVGKGLPDGTPEPRAPALEIAGLIARGSRVRSPFPVEDFAIADRVAHPGICRNVLGRVGA